MIETYGGLNLQLSIQSELEKGTTVSLILGNFEWSMPPELFSNDESPRLTDDPSDKLSQGFHWVYPGETRLPNITSMRLKSELKEQTEH